MSVEEKIRKAEEIYNRRNGNKYIYQNSYKEQTKKGPSLKHRMVKQIIICFLIYGIFYVVTNREYFLSQEFRLKVEQMASQNETTQKAYNWVIKYLEQYIKLTDENKSTTQSGNQL